MSFLKQVPLSATYSEPSQDQVASGIKPGDIAYVGELTGHIIVGQFHHRAHLDDQKRCPANTYFVTTLYLTLSQDAATMEGDLLVEHISDACEIDDRRLDHLIFAKVKETVLSDLLIPSLAGVDSLQVAWGVDSAAPADSKAVDGTNRFDSVVQRAGVAPVFWGRYIGGAFALTPSEIKFIHDKGAKILIIYNGATNSKKSVQGGIAEGSDDAEVAIAAAMALKIPSGIAIYADIEGSWAVTPDWLRGWTTTLSQKQLVPGFYSDCTPTSPFARAYCEALQIDQLLAASTLWSMEPELDPQCRAGALAPAFHPHIPACGGEVGLWQYTEGCWEDTLGVYGGIDMNLATTAVIPLMW